MARQKSTKPKFSSEYRAALAVHCREYRKARKLTQEAMAGKFGRDNGVEISRLERGACQSVSVIQAVAKLTRFKFDEQV